MVTRRLRSRGQEQPEEGLGQRRHRGAVKAHLPALLVSGLLRAARTFLQAFLAVLTAAPVLDVSVPTLKAAAMAGVASVLALAQRFLDDTSVPTIPPG